MTQPLPVGQSSVTPCIQLLHLTGAGPSSAKYKQVLERPSLGRAPPSKTFPPNSAAAAGASVATTAACANTSAPPASLNLTRGSSTLSPTESQVSDEKEPDVSPPLALFMRCIDSTGVLRYTQS